MKLDVGERIILQDVLSQIFPEADYASFKEVRKMREILNFTAEEREAYKISVQNGQWSWSTDAAQYLADLPLSEFITTKIQDHFRTQNSKQKLKEREMSLYEKFLVQYDQV